MAQVLGGVKWILRLEGLAIFITALCLYTHFDFGWGIFAFCFLVPDLSFLAYLVNNKAGAILYNFAHSFIGAFLVCGLGFALEMPFFQLAGLIWTAHIGFDRVLGYGLKYQQGFGYTHLGLIGHAKNK